MISAFDRINNLSIHPILTDDNLSEDALSDDGQISKENYSDKIKDHREFGWPLLPRRGDISLKDAKGIIHAYVTASYRELSHNHSLYI